MSAENIYQYLKENPEYRPNKFDIVGGFGGGDPDFDIWVRRLSAADIDVDVDRAIVVGSGEKPRNRLTASTVEPGLLELFKDIDAPSDHVDESSTAHNTQSDVVSADNQQVIKSPVTRPKTRRTFIGREEDEPTRFCDVDDDILDHCPMLAGELIMGEFEPPRRHSKPGSPIVHTRPLSMDDEFDIMKLISD